jgi:hypothetical protein
MPTTINDPEFGTIHVLRSRQTRYVRVRVRHDGRLSATLPMRASLNNVHHLIDESRASLRQTLAELQTQNVQFTDGQHIGSSHHIVVKSGTSVAAQVRSPNIYVSFPADYRIESPVVQKAIKEGALRALRIEAKAYLPRRLRAIAETYDFHFQKVRFSSASTRWGSCSAHGTISLNVWLMQLPLEIIDYVLVHELCHTRHMNHSQAFWDLVEHCDPDYKTKRAELKQHHPYA